MFSFFLLTKPPKNSNFEGNLCEILEPTQLSILNIIIKIESFMKKNIFLTTILLWLMAASVHAAVWRSTWTKENIKEHVQYIDKSVNCIVDDNLLYPQFIFCDNDNNFEYLTSTVRNSTTNPGHLDVEYFLLDKVTLKPNISYILKFYITTAQNYSFLKDAKVQVQLKKEPKADAQVLKNLGNIYLNYYHYNSPELQQLKFTSAPTEGYVCIKITGSLIGESYNCIFSDFSIIKEGVIAPEITNQPEVSIDIDTDNIPTLSVTATGDNISYKWYQNQQKYNSFWEDTGVSTSNFKPIYSSPNYQYKCLVSNEGGDDETNIITVNSVIVHGTEYPEHSGVYYAAVSMPGAYSLDENTFAYKAVLNETKTALNIVPVDNKDIYIPYDNKGLILQSNKERIVLAKPQKGWFNTNYYDNMLTSGSFYSKGTSYVLGFKNGKIGMYLGEEDEVPSHIAIFNKTQVSNVLPDELEINIPLRYVIAFDKNCMDATGTMKDQILYNDGKSKLNTNVFSRKGYMFLGWSTSADGKVEYTDGQLIVGDIPFAETRVTLYAKWKKIADLFNAAGEFVINSNQDWGYFCLYVNTINNGVNVLLAADITTPVTEMVGTENRPYSGTFDGGGHKITVNYEGITDRFVAPFKVTNGATIKNLTVDGNISTSERFAAGIIARNKYENAFLEKCVSKVNIVSESGGSCYYAGLVANTYANIDIIDCAFTGSITQSKNCTESTFECAGLVGSADKSIFINNCLLTATFGISDEKSNTFVPSSSNDIIVRNSYYLNALGEVPSGATQIKSETLESGEALTLLGNGWAQILGTDNMPKPYNESKKPTPNYVYNDGTDWVCDDFQLKDKEEVGIGIDFTAKNLSYDRNFTIDDGYYTVYAPFAIPTTNGKLYACTGINAEKSQAEFTEVATPEPNTAYIFKPATTKLNFGNDMAVKKTTNLESQTGYMRGVYTLLTFTDENKEGCYGYAAEAKDGYEAGAFVKFGADATVPAGRAYIYAPEAIAAGAKRLKVVINGEPTGISIPVADSTNGSDIYYNLSGQRVGNSYKGIVVSNGKKIVRK